MKRLLITSPKGGAGKTHLAKSIAIAAAKEGLTVATADLDPQESLTKWWGRRPSEVPKPAHYPVRWEQAEALTADDGVEPCDLLVIDTPPGVEANPEEMRRLISAADLILVPVRPSYDDVESAAPYLQALRRLGRPAVAVLNQVMPRVNINAEKALLLDAGELAPAEIRHRTDHQRASARGLSVVDLPKHDGAEEIDLVWRFVRGRLFPPAPAKAAPAEARPKGVISKGAAQKGASGKRSLVGSA